MNIRNRQHELRETLAEFYAELDRKWEEAEDLLLSFGIPEQVSVPVKTIEPKATDRPFVTPSRHELGFVKQFSKWALCYGISAAEDPTDTFWTSIRHCSAEQKVEASKCFPDLLKIVLENAESYSETVLNAVNTLELSLAGEMFGATRPTPAPPVAEPETITEPEPVSEEEPPADSEAESIPIANASDDDPVTVEETAAVEEGEQFGPIEKAKAEAEMPDIVDDSETDEDETSGDEPSSDDDAKPEADAA